MINRLGGMGARGWGRGGAGSGLYAFTSATFYGGGTGLDGPSLSTARANLSGPETATWKNDTAFFNTSSGIQLWTVPATRTYRILAIGASGGSNQAYGGRGIAFQGDISLTAGEIIKILTGQGGVNNGTNSCETGGGGGTFVVNNANLPLIIAGGGGGTCANISGGDGVHTQAGGASYGGIGGGTGGQGGNCSQGTAGAGFSGNGCAAGWNSGNMGGVNNGIAQSFLNGGQGGSSTQASPNINGGFGGGGSGHGNCYIGGPGGGGYSGGGAGNGSGYGGGGGSHFATTVTNRATSNGLYDGIAVSSLGYYNNYSTLYQGSSTWAPNGYVTITAL
jgi:hypothetical protein